MDNKVNKIYSDIVGMIRQEEYDLDDINEKEDKNIYDLIEKEIIKARIEAFREVLEIVYKHE